MGAVILAAHRFRRVEKTEHFDELFNIINAVVRVPAYIEEEIKSALRGFITHPGFPHKKLTASAMEACKKILDEAADTKRADSIMVHSYLQFCSIYGWDPMRLPACKDVACHYNQYLPMRRTVSLITLAVILSEDQASTQTY